MIIEILFAASVASGLVFIYRKKSAEEDTTPEPKSQVPEHPQQILREEYNRYSSSQLYAEAARYNICTKYRNRKEIIEALIVERLKD